MNRPRSKFVELRQSSGFNGKGLIVMDDGGSTIRTNDGPQKRQTWVAVLIPPDQAERSIVQMEQCVTYIRDRFGAREFHSNEIFQRKGPWADVSIEELKGVVGGVAKILGSMKFPIIVQTFWKGNKSYETILDGTTDAQIRTLKREYKINYRSPKDIAFLYCLKRCRDFVGSEYPDAKWDIFADEGMKKAGLSVRVPVRWGRSQLATVNFEDSIVCQLIQLADFAAYFLNRSQQIEHSNSPTVHDEELLDILGRNLNFINIPYKSKPRWHA